MKKVLIIAYAFPPMGVAGSLRPLGFVKYLPRYGWQPIVLTIRKRPDIFQDNDLLSEIPPGTHVHRTHVWDPWVWKRLRDNKAETLRVTKKLPNNSTHDRGKEYFPNRSIARNIKQLIKDLITTPDYQIIWFPFAAAEGLRLFARFKYDAILTTSPPHSSHLIGLALSRLTKRPWIADFRDPWTDNPLYDTVPRSRFRKHFEKRLEQSILGRAVSVICNTNINKERITREHLDLPSCKFKVLPNGFDKELIDSIESCTFSGITITHMGIFYPQLKPYFFFEALSQWIKERSKHIPMVDKFQVLLVGSREESLSKLLHDLDLNGYVRFLDRVSHQEAIRIAKGSDALLVSLGFDRNVVGWIPLKLYDYLGCRKPILAFLPDGSEAAEIITNTQSGRAISICRHEEVFNFLDQLVRINDGAGFNQMSRSENEALLQYEQATIVESLVEILDDARHQMKLRSP